MSLKLLDRLQKKALRLLKIYEPLKFGIVPLSHRRNVASLESYQIFSERTLGQNRATSELIYT